MLTIIKLVVLIVFMILSSKAIGQFILEKLNKETEETLGIGFLANLSLFWIIEFFVMFFKLPSLYLNIFGSIYLVIALFIIIRNIVKYKKVTFTKKELVAIVITLLLMCLYCFFVHFGYIETYDSYFYSVLTNSARNTSHISVIDPYTGQENLQNYYKYISYYYQATFLGNIIGIQDSYLVLVWVMTFMNYLFISITALTVTRTTKNKYINNILTAFLFTFLTSIFRAPFNALHLVTMIIPIYCFKYMFDLFKKDKSSLFLLIISIVSTITITSTSLFVVFAFLYVFFVVASFLNRKDLYKEILIATIPVIILAFMYVYESLDSYIAIVLLFFTLTILFLLINCKKIIDILPKLGKISVVIIVALLVLIGSTNKFSQITKYFTKNDAVLESDMIVGDDVEGSEFTYENKGYSIEYKFDVNRHSSSMEYIYENNQSILSKILILLSHSTLLYGGMVFLLIYGIIKKEKKPEFIALYIYIIAFYNPLVKNGLRTISMNLEARIYLFFNTIFALYGIKYLVELLDEKITDKTKKLYEVLKKYGSYVYIILVITSIASYISNFNLIDTNEYNLLYKVPNSILDVDKYMEENENNNLRIFYTANTFNISLIDKKANEKLKIINSKEYMGYFEDDEKTLTDKIVISAFFDTEGQAKIKSESKEFDIQKDRLEKLIDYFRIEYIVCKKSEDREFIDYIQNNYDIIYSNNEIQVLKVI